MEIADCLLIERVRELHPYLGKGWEFSSYLPEKACSASRFFIFAIEHWYVRISYAYNAGTCGPCRHPACNDPR